MPLARRLWRVCKELRLPLSSPFIQEMDLFDLEFYEYSIICDDPELLKKLENTYVDPEFDKWVEEFDKEQEELQKKKQKQNSENYTPELPDQETISWSNTPKPQRHLPPMLERETYEISPNIDDVNDWVKEE